MMSRCGRLYAPLLGLAYGSLRLMQPFDFAAGHAQWRSSRRLFSVRGTDSIGEIIRRRPREFTETRN
jgi:hypothetical protein